VAAEDWWRRHSPGCLLHRTTGLHCPGCGGTRAFYALLRGDWAAAVRWNFLAPLLVLAAAGWGLWWCLSGVPRLAPWLARRTFPAWLAWALGAAALLFALLRNLPWWPFCVPAPC
jgi:hypothetical protein